MKPRPTLFLSGVSHEFGSFRDAVENEIEMKGCFAENQPGFPPDWRTVEEMLRRKLHDSDAVVHIVGFRFGAEPNQRPAGIARRSYTQMEFDIAREMQKPVFVFLSKDATVRQPAAPGEKAEDPDATALQLAHRAAVTETNHLYYFFKDQAELCKLVAEIPIVAAAGRIVDFSRIVKYAPAELIGREDELKLLNDAWAKVQNSAFPRLRVLTFVALGGEGKTSLVAKWAADLAAQDWPGCDAVFAWSFYSQGTREQTAVSSDLFLTEALAFFGDEAMAKSAAGAFDKGRRLAQLVGERRALLILDGLEPLQYAPTSPTPGELKDQGLAALLKGLAAASHGLCVVTTRYALPDLRAFHGQTVREEKLTRLARAAGVRLLKAHGVTGSDRPNLPHTGDAGKKEMLSEFEALVEDVDGHALTLHLMGSFLKRAFQGDIRRRDRVKFEKADQKTDNGHAFRAMAAYEKWMADGSEEARRELALLTLMGLFDRPATADCLQALLKAPAIAGLTEPLVGLPEEDWNGSLSALQDARLLTVNRDAAGTLLSLDAHPLLREYFGERMKDEGRRMKAGVPPSSFILPTSSFSLAHRRLYEHLCATTPDQPDATLEDLQPLYQAVAHGCQAGLQQEACANVYRDRILRGPEAYTLHKLGAHGSDLGAIACLFEQTWSRLSPALSEPAQAWLLNEAAFRLRALGRLTEALEPMRAGVEMANRAADEAKDERTRLHQSKEAAIRASNLSELELTLGEVAGAVGDAEQSVTYADRSGDAFQRMARRTTHADALHQADRRAEAEARFREAEQMQAERQPAYPLLYSLPGFQYCDLLLTAAERAAWQRCGTGFQPVGPAGVPPGVSEASAGKMPAGPTAGTAVPQACRAVSERAAQTLKWANQAREASLLDIALDHLTLGRAALYAAILESPSSFILHPSSLASAVSGLRRAGHSDELPKALLTRAWQRSLTGVRTGPESAQSDLDEAWEIAARGPMPLFLADIHLYRARLFFREAHYPFTHPDGTPRTPQQDLADARKIITKITTFQRPDGVIESHSYLRRLPELEDAETAIFGIPSPSHTAP